MPEELVNVRYMVDDVEAAVAFYTTHFGFTVRSNAAPAFADVVRGHLRLLLSGPKSSAGRPMPDGRIPEPGGWNRLHFIVDDIDAGSSSCALPTSRSGTTSSADRAAARSCSKTPPATRSSCSSPPGREYRARPPHPRPAPGRGDRRSDVDDRDRGPAADRRPAAPYPRLRRGLLHARGELIFQVDEALATKGAGEFSFAPRGVPHTLANHSDAPARYVLVCAPAGFERHWARMSAEAAGVEPPAWAQQPIPEVTVVGPPIAAEV